MLPWTLPSSCRELPKQYHAETPPARSWPLSLHSIIYLHTWQQPASLQPCCLLVSQLPTMRFALPGSMPNTKVPVKFEWQHHNHSFHAPIQRATHASAQRLQFKVIPTWHGCSTCPRPLAIHLIAACSPRDRTQSLAPCKRTLPPYSDLSCQPEATSVCT